MTCAEMGTRGRLPRLLSLILCDILSVQPSSLPAVTVNDVEPCTVMNEAAFSSNKGFWPLTTLMVSILPPIHFFQIWPDTALSGTLSVPGSPLPQPECLSEDHPLAPPPLSHQPAQPGLRPPLQSGLRRREEAPVPAPLPSRAFPAAPPALRRRPAKPVPLPDCDRGRLGSSAPCPRPAPAAPLPLPEPRRWSPGGQARPGRSGPRARPSSPVPASGLCHHWPGRPGFHLPPRPPSLCSAGRLTGRHAPAMGHLPPRPGLGATHPGRLGSPGRIPTPAGEGGACAGRWGQA